MVEVKNSNIHGRGVFAISNISKNTVMYNDVILVNDNILSDYQYPWLAKTKSICMGFGSFFNHSIEPNIQILKIDKIKLRKYFIILRDIKKGEELLLKYMAL